MPRLPRFKRVPPVAPIQLTERDHNIIRLVYRHRFLRSSQIVALVDGSEQQVVRRLQLLFHHGYYMEFALSHKGQQWNGEFHTPKTICDLMARITLGDMESMPAEGPITVCEPACGAGAMILSLGEACSPEARRRLRVTAIDISRTACDMAFINTTLWGIPTRLIHGNTLSNEYWSAWSNIHYIAPWLPLAMRPQAPEVAEQGQPPKPIEVERIRVSLGQQELTL